MAGELLLAMTETIRPGHGLILQSEYDIIDLSPG
jgi:hypothetical protein